jgi:cell division protein FtsL
MKPEAFEYALKKDIRNNPIVRQVDEERHREMWRWAFLGLLIVMVLVFSAWRQFALMWHGKERSELEQLIAEAEEEQRHLLLELDSLNSLSRIEEVATRRLQMMRPGQDDLEVIERVIPSAPAPHSAVASR